jgi:hypothetical protein
VIKTFQSFFLSKTEVLEFVLGGFTNKVIVAEYQVALPDEETLLAELKRTPRLLQDRQNT